MDKILNEENYTKVRQHADTLNTVSRRRPVTKKRLFNVEGSFHGVGVSKCDIHVKF